MEDRFLEKQNLLKQYHYFPCMYEYKNGYKCQKWANSPTMQLQQSENPLPAFLRGEAQNES